MIDEIPEDLALEYPDLRKTAWTWEMVDALERQLEEHLHGCDECQAASRLWFGTHDVDTDDIDTLVYCPVGESFQMAWADAAIEWSWQQDFPGADDPRWGEWARAYQQWFDALWA